MPPTPRTLPRQELKGLEVEVVASANSSLVGLKGKVTDESRNMLEVKTESGTRSIPKAGTTFMFALPGGVKATIDGKRLVGRPGSKSRARIQKW